MQITPAVNYSPLCKPRENRPFGFPATGQRKQQLLACLLLIKPKAREPPGCMFLGLNAQTKTGTCALRLLLFPAQDEELGPQLCRLPAGSMPQLLPCSRGGTQGPSLLDSVCEPRSRRKHSAFRIAPQLQFVCLSGVNHWWIFWVASSSLQQRLTLAASAVKG